jgi:hypothetical protein
VERDLRIDFFRGTALFLLLWFHLVAFSGLESPFFRLTPGFWGFSDASELFVFLAGYVIGAVYWRGLKEKGLLLTECRALHRSSQLYLANIFTFVVVMGIVAFLHNKFGADFGYLKAAFGEPAKTFPHLVGLTYIPYGFSILPLYIVLLAGAPIIMGLFQKKPWLALGLSLLLYTCAQLSNDFNLPRYEGWHGRWTFNPFGWQLVFSIGAIMGMRKRQGKTGVPWNRWLMAAAAVIVMVAPVMRVLVILANRDIFGLGAHLDLLMTVTFPYAGMAKVNQDPIRLIHFLAVVYLAAHLTRGDHPFWSSRVAAPVVCCGQHSLEVYCTHLMFLYAAGSLMAVWGAGAGLILLFFAVSSVGLVGAAYLARWKNRAPWRPAKSVASG